MELWGFGAHSFQHFTNENAWTAQMEWLVSDSRPVSVYGGYERSTFSGARGLAANIFFIGLHWYCNPAGTSTLESRQRTGVGTWGTQFGAFAFQL